MSMITPAEFATWNARQPMAFALVDGLPVRLPEADQAPSRLARRRHVAARILPMDEAIQGWMATPQVLLGGQRPETVPRQSGWF